MNIKLLVGVRYALDDEKDATGNVVHKKGERVDECLYCGQDGVALLKAADAARATEDKKWTQIIKFMNPSGAPVALNSAQVQCTKPVFPERAKPVVIQPAQPVSKVVDEQQSKLRQSREDAQRKARLNPSSSTAVQVPEKPSLSLDGPTLEEYQKSGYKPETYPPAGYAEKPSPALTAWKEAQAKTASAPAQ